MEAIAFRRIRQLLGFFIIIIPFIPVRVWGNLGATLSKVDKYALAPDAWLLGTLICFVAGGALIYLTRRSPINLTLPKYTFGRVLVGATFVHLLFLIWLQGFCFDHKAVNVDSISQRFQAKIFAAGRLFAPAPAVRAPFVVQHLAVDGERWYSQYSPGYSLALALGELIHRTWLPDILLSIVSFLGIAVLTKRLFGDRAGVVSILLLLACAFKFFLGVGQMNHIPALASLSIATLVAHRWFTDAENGRTPLRAIVLGLLWGYGFLSRPLPFLILGVVFVASDLYLVRDSAKRWVSARIAGIVGALLMVGFYFYYNANTTGDPFVPGYLKLWGAGHKLGFHKDPWGEPHTPLRGLLNSFTDMSLLNEYLFEGFMPGLLTLGVFALVKKRFTRTEGILFYLFFVTAFANMFYWHRDSFLGPRFVYESLVFLIPLLARGIEWLALELPKEFASISSRLPVRSWALGVCVTIGLSFAYSVAYGIPRRAIIYSNFSPNMKRDIAKMVAAAGEEKAVVLVKTSWGERILGRLYARGFPASVIEEVYRASDHCELDALSRAATTTAEDLLQIRIPLSQIAKGGLRDKGVVNEDGTLRLKRDRMPSAACLEELAYDRKDGFTYYGASILENSPFLNSNLIVGRDMREENNLLTSRYPDYPVYMLNGSNLIKVHPLNSSSS